MVAFSITPAFSAPAQNAVSVQGTVVDMVSHPIASARVTFLNNKDGRSYNASSDGAGAFSIAVPDGDYSVIVNANSVGSALVERDVAIQGETDLRITVTPLSTSTTITVTPGAEGSVPFLAAPAASLTEMRDVPVSANFYTVQDRLSMLPGVSENTRGNLNVNGMPDDQTQWMLYGFGFTSPAPGVIPNPRMPILGVHDVEIVSTGLADATMPPGVGATALIEPQDGCGRHHYDFDNIIPGPAFHSSIGVDSWDPAVSVCGNVTPYLSWNESASTQYSRWWVPGLPVGQNTTPQWLGANSTDFHWQMSDAKTLDFGVVVNVDRAENVGLGPTTYESATRNSGYQYFFSHATYSSGFNGGMFQAGVAETQASFTSRPQGEGLYLVGAQADTGNYFQSLHESTSQPQAFTQVFLPTMSFLGTHAIAVGAGLSYTNASISQSFTGSENLDTAGVPVNKTLYGSVPQFGIPEREGDAFIEDRWSPVSPVSVVLGMRLDHDSLTGGSIASPRISVFYVIPRTHVTVYAGHSTTPFFENPNLFTRPYDWTVSGATNASGQFTGAATVTMYEIGHHLPYPAVQNNTAGLTATLPGGIEFEAQLTEKHSGDALAFTSTTESQFGAIPAYPTIPAQYSGSSSHLVLDDLTAGATFDYRGATVSLRKRWNSTQVFANYTRSSARASAAIDVSDFSPFSYSHNVQGPLPWNIPNRLNVGGMLPTRQWTFGLYGLWQSGLPYTLYLPTGVQFGPVDGYNMPNQFSLNVEIGRKLSLDVRGKRRRFEVVGVVENVTNHPNYLGVRPYLGVQDRFTGSLGTQFSVLVRRG